jgi:ferredoxin--NADP+ reductase
VTDDDPSVRPPPAEVTAYERRLHRAARLRSVDAVDTELGQVLSHVAGRRARRSMPVVPGPVATAAPTALPESPAPAPSGDGTRLLAAAAVGPAIRILQVTRPPGFRFRAGQHVKLGAAGSATGTFSIASAPHDAHLEFCIELIPGGSATPALFATEPGAPLDVAPQAKGSFALDGGVPSHLMIATVTGIAPLRSMLRDALHHGSRDRFVVLHGASHADELPYREELEALAAADSRVEYRPTVSRPSEGRSAGWTGATGRVDDLALAVAPGFDRRSTRVYACGNPAMVERMRTELGRLGFAISTEKFD